MICNVCECDFNVFFKPAMQGLTLIWKFLSFDSVKREYLS